MNTDSEIMNESPNPQDLHQSIHLESIPEHVQEHVQELIQDQSSEASLLQIEQSSSDSIAPDHINQKKSKASDGGKPHQNEFSKAYIQLLKDVEQLELIESKLEKVISFMRDSISQGGVPHFKEFWEAKKHALELFKEHLNPTTRVHLWTQYSEICREARSLKELLDEQSAFACEQIDMAIKALEEDVSLVGERVKSLPDPDFGIISKTIEAHFGQYLSIQKELNLLNAYASRISALRKELMRTELRLRVKNKFFDRLSILGDLLFPRRKNLIRDVSALFSKDVENYIQGTFIGEMKTAELFDVKEEIKSLQGIAKALTLNTETFTKTRKQLSECWDSVREVVTERKKATHELKTIHRENRDLLAKEIDLIQADVLAGTLSSSDAHNKLEGILDKIRDSALGRQDVFALKDQVHALKSSLSVKEREQVSRRKNEELEREQLRLQKIQELDSRLKNYIIRVDAGEAEGAEEALEELKRELSSASCTRKERLDTERLLRRAQESLTHVQENNLLKEGGDKAHQIAALRQVYQERVKRRAELKAHLDSLRKMSSSGNLDFSQAIELQEMIEQEKEKLTHLDEGLKEIERSLKSIS